MKKFLIFASLLVPAFGDTIQFSWSSIANSSITLASGVNSTATGFAGVSSVQDVNTNDVLNIRNLANTAGTAGLFTFTTAGRTTSPGADGKATLAVGGTWSISGTLRDGSTVIASGVLASGTFIGTPTLTNTNGGRNTLASDIDTTFAHAAMLAFFGTPNLIPQTLTMNLTRDGAWNAGTGAFTNSGGAVGSPNGTLAFNALAPVPEPTTFAMLGLGLGAAALIRRKR